MSVCRLDNLSGRPSVEERDVPVIISMLRGVNLGPHNRVKMEALRGLYESLGFRDVQTYVQSGNVVFRTEKRDLTRLATEIEAAIEKKFGFHTDAILRTAEDMRKAIAKNPFAGRRNLEPNKFLVTFLAGNPDPEARKKVLQIKTDPEELRIEGREIYMYFPEGMARPKLTWSQVATKLKTSGTGRNWTTVQALLEMADGLESSP